MREILFRGKRLDNGEWVEGSFLRDGEPHRLVRQEGLPFSDCYIVPKTERDNVRTYLTQGIMLDTIAYHVDPTTVGQYTGLTDKNGKRIFEGDILEGCDFDEENGYGAVEWHDGAFEINNQFITSTFHENYWGARVGSHRQHPRQPGAAGRDLTMAKRKKSKHTPRCTRYTPVMSCGSRRRSSRDGSRCSSTVTCTTRETKASYLTGSGRSGRRSWQSCNRNTRRFQRKFSGPMNSQTGMAHRASSCRLETDGWRIQQNMY